MRKIAFANQKGGTGKTTSALNVGVGLVRSGKRVLAIDLDPSSHLTYSLGIPAHQLELTAYDWLKGEAALSDVLVQTGGLDVVPSNLKLSGAEIEFSKITGGEFLLKETLAGVRGYDFALIDCPPSLGLLTVNALAAVHAVYIPTQTEFLALQGLGKLSETIDAVRKRLNRRLDIGVIATQYKGRRNLDKDVAREIRAQFGAKVFKTMIRQSVGLAESPSYAKDIFSFKPRSHGAEDYQALTDEILRRG